MPDEKLLNTHLGIIHFVLKWSFSEMAMILGSGETDWVIEQTERLSAIASSYNSPSSKRRGDNASYFSRGRAHPAIGPGAGELEGHGNNSSGDWGGANSTRQRSSRSRNRMRVLVCV